MTKTGSDYTVHRGGGADRSIGMIDLPLTNVNCDRIKFNNGREKFRKKTGIAGKTLSLISKKTTLQYVDHEDDLSFKLKRVSSQI